MNVDSSFCSDFGSDCGLIDCSRFFRGLDCLEIGRTVAVVKGGYYVEA